MKILLVGEFSGFFKNLKKGLEDLNHEVILMSGMDGRKKIDGANISIDSKIDGIIGKIEKRLKYLYYVLKLSKFDVIYIVNPNIGLSFISKLFSYILRKKSKNIYLSACGTDIEYINYGLSGKFDYWPYLNCNSIQKRSQFVHENILTNIDFIIPAFYDYAEPWRNSRYNMQVLNTIPLPIDAVSIKTFYPKSKGKIIFFHGLNRECIKGTLYIKEALLNMQKKYPDDIEVIIDGKMPLKEYLNLMQKVDVIVDQCKVYSYGSMNSLYALSMGKIIMGGYRKECREEYKIKEKISGILHIEPNTNQIESQIEYIIKNKSLLTKWGQENRKYVVKYHDSRIIAKNYIDLFEKYNRI